MRDQIYFFCHQNGSERDSACLQLEIVVAEEMQPQKDVMRYFISITDVFQKNIHNIIFNVLDSWDICFDAMFLT